MQLSAPWAGGANPFAPSLANSPGEFSSALAATIKRVVGRIGRRERLVPVVGDAGLGKTLLLAEIERRLSPRRSVTRLQRGDLLDAAVTLPDVLLVDEGERADSTVLRRVVESGWTGTLVLASARDCFPELLAKWRAQPERLHPLGIRETKKLAQARLVRAGRTGLVAPEALDALAAVSEGNPRALVQIGGAAVFLAHYEDAPIVTAEHVHAAAEMRPPMFRPSPRAPTRHDRAYGPRLREALPRLGAAAWRHPEAVAAAAAAFAVGFFMLGGLARTPQPWSRPALPEAQSTRSARPRAMPTGSPPRVASMPILTSTLAISNVVAENKSHITPLMRGTSPKVAKLLADTQSKPTSIASIRVVPAQILTASPAAHPREAQGESELAATTPADIARAAPVSTAVERGEASPGAVLALSLSSPATRAVTAATEPAAETEQAKAIRLAAIKARDAMRDMRIGRGG